MMSIVERLLQLFKPPVIPLALPPVDTPRQIEIRLCNHPNMITVDLIGFSGRLIRCINAYTPTKLHTMQLSHRAASSPKHDIGLSLWLPNATIDATVRVVQKKTVWAEGLLTPTEDRRKHWQSIGLGEDDDLQTKG